MTPPMTPLNWLADRRYPARRYGERCRAAVYFSAALAILASISRPELDQV